MFRKSKIKIVTVMMSVLLLLFIGTLCVIYFFSYIEVSRENQEMLCLYAQAYWKNGSPEGINELQPKRIRTDYFQYGKIRIFTGWYGLGRYITEITWHIFSACGSVMEHSEEGGYTKMVHIRKAKETDRNSVALCIAEGFEKDFSVLCKDNQKVADAIAAGLNMERFYVADIKGDIAGVLAVSDCNGRAARVDKVSLKKYFGFLKGFIGTLVLKEEFEGQLEYPITTGYIEFVAVRKKYRKQGIATTMLKESMPLTNYQDFVLDVTDVNNNAIKCYTNVGFEEFNRIPEKHGKQKGFNEKIFMRYCRR